jgi:hypothetical protein
VAERIPSPAPRSAHGRTSLGGRALRAFPTPGMISHPHVGALAVAATAAVLLLLHARRRKRTKVDSMSDPDWTVPEVDVEPSAEDFFAEHVQQNQPLVIRGAARSWRAMSWSAEYFETFRDEVVSVAPLMTDGPHAYLDKWLEP